MASHFWERRGLLAFVASQSKRRVSLLWAGLSREFPPAVSEIVAEHVAGKYLRPVLLLLLIDKPPCRLSAWESRASPHQITLWNCTVFPVVAAACFCSRVACVITKAAHYFIVFIISLSVGKRNCCTYTYITWGIGRSGCLVSYPRRVIHWQNTHICSFEWFPDDTISR